MSDVLDLRGATVIVTGASSGIGAATARALHAVGAHPVLAARRAGRLTWERSSHAELVVVPADQVTAKPPALRWEVAGGLYVAGCTAFAAVRAVGAGPGDTIAVSAAAGGVGSIAVQLLRLRGARVIAIASGRNADWLQARGATVVDYGDGLEERVRAAAPNGVTAFIDLYGPEYVHLAVRLGIPRDRINTVIAFGAASELGTKAEGSAAGTSTAVLAELAALAADGRIQVPIAATYPLDKVQDAFARLEQRHTFGKIVLIP
ncbi:SDR family NAD(P)-dependent oxidoreductase [Actinomadura sp. NTSP31]|uniref:SDR family NAD(P)-dependent oxidoreductase n=1 Tax=Actinomadura sp. NTSP31 TaxID=1735447 RepID=UPI0035C08E7B